MTVTSLSLVVARMALLVGVLGGVRPHPYHMEKNTKARGGHRALRGDMESHHGVSKMRVGAWRDVAVAQCGGTLGIRKALQCGNGNQTPVDGVTELVL